MVPVETAAVVTYQHARIPDALPDRPQQRTLLVEVAEEILHQPQTVPVAPGEADHEGDRAGATRQPGGFGIEEERSTQLIRCQSQAGRQRTNVPLALVSEPFPTHQHRTERCQLLGAVRRQPARGAPTPAPPPRG